MSKIWDLIKNEKVEWKTIGEVCDIKRGTKITKKIMEENKGEYPVYSSQTTNNGEIGKLNYYMFDGEYVTWTTDGCYAGTFYYRNEKFSATTHCGVLNVKREPKLLTKFLYYYLTYDSVNLKNSIVGTIPLFTSEMVSSIKIPIPSIDTQNKIVKILDKFNIYVKELEHELEHRNKQYQYYNELCFNDDFLKFLSNKYAAESIVENKTLNQLGVFIRGNNLTKKEIKNSGQPVVRYGELHTKYKFETDFTYSFTDNDLFKKLKKAIKNDLMIVLTSEDNDGVCKTCIWSGDYEIGISSDMCIFRGNVNPYFLNHFFTTERFLKQKEKYLSGTNIIRISTDNLGKIDISLPSIVIQNLVSEKLNKLYKLSNSIYEGLPKEIKLRKQQYEYYRNKLLDFPKN
ncbi:restriction endonuclease subunit S [Mycoplasma anatis]|uniref:Restriction endonuclease subunit S n=2 Tax=Mycoplasmopsis anatis TaxID=171279 RepID=A0A9Q3L7F3_9BACT|nr:restriction endonuclease subunit S [Mycoplasmopsis anatis]MBW0595816.1 restriction endonuclease subunit S [Mycoplasmopsis anatis]MBW0600115.1 restriction endonuclease subunit S [Mycoplasmopsis anatis]MBW0602650.1 restriction endonuclease subunit S [Mycoplasmopsis anatis]MBW0604055.1 restriction endonuclease subunit S [Mycoplasmopsis anatis]